MAKKQQEAYGNTSISSLKDEERVRKRPAVIFGSDDLEGCKHAVFEILSNAIDEAREGYGDTIIVTRYQDLSVEVEDFGRGCPVDYNEREKRYNWELVFCELYAGGKYDNENSDNYEYSLGLNGLGSCATQYASRYMDVTVCRDGKEYRLHFERGEIAGEMRVTELKRRHTGIYVGYEEAGQLTEKVRRRPYSVVLFDEIEKAHPDVMNILLQILDEGKINDAQGRTVDFSNTVICMTSNAGSSDKTTSGLGFNKSEEQLSEEKTRKALSQFLRPEFLGRVDEVIAFKPLSQQTLEGIAALMLDEYKPSMEAKGIAYSYTPAALSALVARSQGGKFGARDLRRVIRKAVEDPAAESIIDGTLKAGGSLTVDAENGEVILK